MIEHDDTIERQADLFNEFLDHYEASETKAAVEMFCQGLFGKRGEDA